MKTYQRDTTHTPVQIQLAKGYQVRAELLNKLQRFTEAVADWEQALKFCREPERIEFKIQQAYSLLWSGATDDALSKANALSQEPSLSRYHQVGLSKVYASASAKVPDRAEEFMSQARASLKKAIELGFDRLDQLQNEPDLLPLLSEPYFQELMAARKSSATKDD